MNEGKSKTAEKNTFLSFAIYLSGHEQLEYDFRIIPKQLT